MHTTIGMLDMLELIRIHLHEAWRWRRITSIIICASMRKGKRNEAQSQIGTAHSQDAYESKSVYLERMGSEVLDLVDNSSFKALT
jgi:hypothetical protein